MASPSLFLSRIIKSKCTIIHADTFLSCNITIFSHTMSCNLKYFSSLVQI
uniref:Uncharacterized protein n=1 Tax=Octopus bimaculoides TaxID=37653 RepID=A0A0L8I5R0_OCTBM